MHARPSSFRVLMSEPRLVGVLKVNSAAANHQPISFYRSFSAHQDKTQHRKQALLSV